MRFKETALVKSKVPMEKGIGEADGGVWEGKKLGCSILGEKELREE